ncbi:HAD-IIIA family hydrolase [Streptomyces sp. C]|uniref:D-glycero-alpha-D-manno-heptose-1,7-bisphosphate 7-phosphatase n=1 Tax=Streptomyces sp. C TaxID=253839 RepID=UPI0001B5670C|nr:HAD-IIIA family hydrolase [Streptomyces sp. C]EFL13272.1 HAD family hydrolase [Streptomyces sp. C]
MRHHPVTGTSAGTSSGTSAGTSSGTSAGGAPAAAVPWLWDRPAAPGTPHRPGPAGRLPEAVLFDRDGTLVADVPYNGDPARVSPLPTALAAVTALRELGIPVGVVSNQSGVARGLLTREDVLAVRRRVDELFGPFDVWAVCPHGPADRCGCRKPAPGLILAACQRLGAAPERTVVVGDIGADVRAASAAGARGVLVPTPVTRPEEVAAAAETARDLLTAVRLVSYPSASGAGRAGAHATPGAMGARPPAVGGGR